MGLLSRWPNQLMPSHRIFYPLVSIAASLAVVCLHYIYNSGFYFIDDSQAYYYPALVEMGRLIESGEAPWMTLRSWFAGNIAGEYVAGVFNPITLLFGLLAANSNNLAVVAFELVLTHVAICALGVYFLARCLRISPSFAALAGFAVASNNYLLYWYSAAYAPALIAFSWFPWGGFFLLKSYRDGRYILPGALAVYMILASGYAATTVALTLFLGLVLVADLYFECSWAAAARVSIAAFTGLMLALPALVPFIAQYEDSWRPTSGGEQNLTSFLSASFPGLISFGFPSYLPVMATWGPMFSGKYGVVEMPFYYAGWFLILPLAYFNASKATAADRRLLLALCLGTAALFFLSMMPSIMPFRWSFRYISYFHLGLVVTGCFVLSRPGFLTYSRTHAWAAVAVVAFLAIISIETSPHRVLVHLLFLLMLGPAAFFYPHIIARRGRALFLVAVSLVVAAVTANVWRGNPELTHPGLPHKVSDIRFLGSEGENLDVLVLSDQFCCDRLERQDVVFGNAGYLTKNRFLNGYSVMEPKGVTETLCMHRPWGHVCPDIARRLFVIDKMTGLALIDLLRLDVIVARKGTYVEEFLRSKTDNWIIKTKGYSADSFGRRTPLPPLPGTITYLPPGIMAMALSTGTDEETFRIKVDDSYDGNPIIFQRAWYPGYRASLDGNPLHPRPYGDLFVSVRVPEHLRGEYILRLHYELPGSPWTFFAASLGLGMATLGSLFLNRFQSHQKQKRSSS